MVRVRHLAKFSRTLLRVIDLKASFSFSSMRTIHIKQLPIFRLETTMFCSTSLLSILFWQFCKISTSLAQKCYLPNGSEAFQNTPCGSTSSSQASACCHPWDTCLSNRLCFDSQMLTNRGSCTDPTWQSDGCAPWCQDGEIFDSNTVRSSIS